MNQQETEVASEPQSKGSLRLWLRLLRATRIIETQLRENLRRDWASTLPRFDVLAALYRYKNGLKMSEISKELKVSNGNVTGIVDRLVNDGSVVRVPVVGDRRALLIKLTTKGRHEFSVLADKHKQWIEEMMASFPTRNQEDLMGQLDELVRVLEAEK